MPRFTNGRNICEKVKQLRGKEKRMKEKREKDFVTNAWNAVAKKIEIGRFLLFSRKNN